MTPLAAHSCAWLPAKNLVKIIRTSHYLKELDLSWNELSHKQILALTEVLANNRILINLNLSWNSLTLFERGTAKFNI